MVKVSVMYPNQSGAAFNMDYYSTRHMALVRKLLGDAVKGLAIDRGIDSAESHPPYLVVGHLWFESIAAFQSAMAAHSAALMADIPNYTNLQPAIQVSEIILADHPAAAETSTSA